MVTQRRVPAGTVAIIAANHPLDSAGLVLPHAGWPPGKQAPGVLEQLRQFCNSTNPESGAERFRTPAELDAWLGAAGLPRVATDRRGLRRVLRFREQLRRLAVANRDGRDDFDAIAELVASAGTGSLGIGAVGGRLTLEARGHGVAGLCAHLAAIVVLAQADGTWRRLKACSNDHCRWLYFDQSKNANGAWCSMSACGQRHKAREYRARRASRTLAR
jgi:predicted RNA-binding Zn ribbon-like protein